MSKNPESYISQECLREEFPYLEGWVNDTKNDGVLMRGDKRLKSPQERLDAVGGRSPLQTNLAILPQYWRSKYLTLLVCISEPMTRWGIRQFELLVGRERTVMVVKRTVDELMETGELQELSGLTYIKRLAYPANTFRISRDLAGFTTTEAGIRNMHLRLDESRGRIAGFRKS